MRSILYILFFLSSVYGFSQCSASFTFNSSQLTVNFNDSSFSTLGFFNSSWDFGDSSTSNLLNPTHTYINIGTYNVCLTIQDTLNCSSTFCDSISVTAPCNANYSYFTDTNNTVFFTNSSITPPNSQYEWDFGDSSALDTARNPVHTYNSSNIYVVELTINGSGLTCIKKDSLFVNFCEANFNYLADSTGTVNFTNLSLAPKFGVAYDWDFGDSTTVINQENPSHSYTKSGIYLVTLYLNDSLNNCNNSYTDSITINMPPSCNAQFSSTSNQDTLFLVNEASNYNSISYTFGDGNSSNLEAPFHIYNGSGSYIVCQTVRDSSKNCSSTFCDTVLITITPPCIANFAYSVNLDSVLFVNLATNYTSILYSFGDGDSSILENPTHVYTLSGNYQACQTVFDSTSNCSDIFCDSIEVIVPPSCKAGFNYRISGDSVIFTSTAERFNRVVYRFGDSDSSNLTNPIHFYQNSGTYIVQQIIYNDTSNCINQFLDTIEVTVSQSCVASYQIAIDTNKRSKLFLINNSSNDPSHIYFWTFGDGLTGTGRTPTHTYTSFGAYQICLTVSDSILQCSSTYCDSVGLDSNGNVLKANGYTLQVIDGVFIGIEQQTTFDNINIYPNPTASDFSIELPNYNGLYEYEVIDLNGRIILNNSSTAKIETLSLEGLKKGVYFVRISTRNHTITKKMVKH